MVASSSAAKAAKTSNHKQTGSTATTADFKQKAKAPPTPAQRRAKQLVDKRYRANKKRKFEELLEENLRMGAELEEKNSHIVRITNENQELWRALKRQEAKEELMKQIPCAWKVDGTNFTSFDQAETWFLSQTYDQGPNDTNNNATTSAAAGPSCVANHGLPKKADNNPFSHDPAAGFPTASVVGSSATYLESASVFDALDNLDISSLFTDHDLAAEFPNLSAAGPSFITDHDLTSVFDALDSHDISDLSTDHDLAAAGSSFVAGHDLPVLVDVPNNHDTISNLFTHDDPAAENESGFPIGFVAGSSAGNHDLHAPKSYDISGLFTHYPAADEKAAL
ncbi:uncharacterized protein LOC110426554 [Herrania umbratica]|uniref:Uncharacterized protein LOC110426554 n=1 Tax=Herrania umbratica TaxID=108875 RepID=A0A6J1BGN7_9ROSI|nr:uncharacterized protein LOC110426554 [Herrania umbratica]XP_021297478.1 uncharacterized protein LOC110426554 [Herrania umbratica]XP_021297485.1 uncharacterized protein LOC110426554 [Herrania umbratica]